MSEPGADGGAGISAPPVAAKASVLQIFLAFLIIGSTSFGGAVPYLREHLVTRRKWLDDKTFVELLSISQSLPGLNATNMAILVGDRLGGAPGAVAGIVGMCLPGAIIMFVVGVLYREHGDHPWSAAALKGVAAASVGLILSTVVQLSEKSLGGRFDFVFVALTVVAVNGFHVSVPVALIGIGALAILWHRPKKGA
jgi:chromate transporter